MLFQIGYSIWFNVICARHMHTFLNGYSALCPIRNTHAILLFRVTVIVFRRYICALDVLWRKYFVRLFLLLLLCCFSWWTFALFCFCFCAFAHLPFVAAAFVCCCVFCFWTGASDVALLLRFRNFFVALLLLVLHLFVVFRFWCCSFCAFDFAFVTFFFCAFASVLHLLHFRRCSFDAVIVLLLWHFRDFTLCFCVFAAALLLLNASLCVFCLLNSHCCVYASSFFARDISMLYAKHRSISQVHRERICITRQGDHALSHSLW